MYQEELKTVNNGDNVIWSYMPLWNFITKKDTKGPQILFFYSANVGMYQTVVCMGVLVLR